MKTKVNFSKIKSCDQIWESMEICQGRRKCSKCSHVITDFRGMTEWDIAVIHAHSNEKVCGLYDDHILDSTNNKERRNQIKKMAIVPSLFTLLLSSTQAQAQTSLNDAQDQVVFTNQTMNNADLEVIKEESNQKKLYNDSIKIVRGFLFDSAKEPIIGGNIIIQGSNKGTITDINGAFSLDLTSEFENKTSVKLIISYTGYGKQILDVSLNEFNESFELIMKPIVIKGDIMITSFGVKRESFPQRIWRRITSIFKKKK